MDGMIVTVLRQVDDDGVNVEYERFERLLDLSCIEHGVAYKTLCEGCERYGHNLACPPYSPMFLDYVGEATLAKVICLRFQLKRLVESDPGRGYRTCSRVARSVLLPELMDYRRKGYRVAGAGPCMACSACAVEFEIKDCRIPSQRIFSLESLGVNVGALVKTCFDIDLSWSGNDRVADSYCTVVSVFMSAEDSAAIPLP